ncbi:hypothetical protein JQV27_00750 [Sulfitobacter mediterraneus]|uniref:hypothetical protein n=1 Tax=Sulfitobacter mediterraneus TaxID=83219 RepID=UPI001931D45C|nr:hypothetical protein [Sulfitobacter mediterraneus]MBM1631351.1 hypothetical protein [Sulfitobacter mediterraneus]MBM1639165.1 hypothetical protein [Sulfitobacter mediterraneus]MBM1643214.1 hypothetical protein [Sulfitobacter mediterraneus]MBM1647261.1 hypothetical protein [Sulfitobacter mediterraneus]MBM1651305.1 hypothetical protein [Sulfitobacter mediterraneus]
MPNRPFAPRSKNSLLVVVLASICVYSTASNAQDELGAGIVKLQESLNVIVGDGSFDQVDEEYCRGVLWTSNVTDKQEIEDRLSRLSDKDFGVMNLTGQIQSYQEKRSEFLFLYNLALDREGTVELPRELYPDADQFSSACSIIVRQQMEDPEFAQIAESARSQASFSVISDLLYELLRERAR